MRTRLITYNVRSLRAGAGAVAEAIAEIDPDIALLQECGRRSPLLRMAEGLAMDVVSTHRLFNRVRNAVLFTEPWRVAWREVHDLPRQGRTLPRGYLVVNLRRAGIGLTIISAHLGLTPGEREAHVREITDFATAIDDPVAIGVDLNEGPDGVATRWISARLFDAFERAGEGRGDTFPAAAPSARIDFVFVSSGIEVHRAWVSDSPTAARASDHRPVVVNLELPGS